MRNLLPIQVDMRMLADADKSAGMSRYFKTGKGEYGEGDRFLGLATPQVRQLVKKYADMNPEGVQALLKSEYNEERAAGLSILVNQYQKKGSDKAGIVDFYLKNTKYINNWNLVDTSCHYILGDYIYNYSGDYDMLFNLAESKNLWERRIAVITTLYFVMKKGETDAALGLVEKLLGDDHDLIHKANGWVLREVGKKDMGALEDFLGEHGKSMPRTTLRYAIERFPEDKRKEFLQKTKK